MELAIINLVTVPMKILWAMLLLIIIMQYVCFCTTHLLHETFLAVREISDQIYEHILFLFSRMFFL